MKPGSPFPPVEDTELVLEELFRHTPVGVVLSDLHGTIIDANDALCRMLGYERAELVGHTILEVSHPDDVADVVTRTAALREGRAGHYSTERRYIARDGSTVHAKVSVSLVYTKDREAICGIAFIEDITQRVVMENELRRSELRYRRVVEDQTELIVRCLPDGTRIFVNEAYCRYNGATAEELIGTSFFTCMNEEERRLVQAKFDALRPANPAITDQHWVVGPGGVMRWHEWTDRGFFDDAGRLVEIQSVGRDLTEEYEARQRLIESEDRYRRLFNGLPVAVWENDWSQVTAELARRNLTTSQAMVDAVAMDPALYPELGATVRVTTANPAALAMAGVASVEEFDHWLAGAATPEAAMRFSAHVPRLVFGELKVAMDEYTLIRADGEPIDVLIRIARSGRWGEACMMSTIAVDVTERKRIQRELEHKQKVTERAEVAAQHGTWEWNLAEDLVYGSAGFWRIIDGPEAGGSPRRTMAEVLAVMHPDDSARTGAMWETLRAPSADERPAVLENEYRLIRPDGSVAVARGQNFASYGPDGALVRAFGILRDTTDARRAEEDAARHRDELVRADKMISLGILVSGIAHEVNNPNHSIGLNAPLVRDAWRDAARVLDEIADTRDDLRIGRMPWSEARGEVAAMVEDIELASERIRNIVTELRGFAIDHDPAERRPVAVNDIVASSLRLLGKHIARATRRFTAALANDVPPVLGNARRLEQVVVNLVLNACQALQSEEQAISIHTGVDRQRAFIRVCDEGRGIAPEHLPQIRTPFFTTKRAEGGTGLGVPVSDLIAVEHGGELTFESELGRGTTATLWLPLGQP
jgi:PAS domain S-box-containing protein